MILDYYIAQSTKPIAYCILDILDNCESRLAKETSINTIDYLIHYAVKKGFDIFVGKDEQELLNHVSATNKYSHAVMISLGTYLGRNDRLYEEIESLCQQQFFIAGHVLYRDEKYIELHQQFYIVNLKEYISLGNPIIGYGDWNTVNEHEQFVPVIDSDDGKIIQSMRVSTERRRYTHKLHGYNILKTALENNKTVIDLGAKIRSIKRFLYPDLEHVFLEKYTSIFSTRLFNHTYVTAWNSDNLFESIPVTEPVEQYITVGTGLNWVKNLNHVGFTQDTTVIFTDINPNCLAFMEELITTWDGVDYDSFYQSFKQYYCDEIPESILKQFSSTKHEFESFKATFEDWDILWDKVKRLKFMFKLIDFTGNYDLSWVEPNKRTIFNISNLFNYHPLIALQSVKFRVMCENKLLIRLRDINPDIFMIATSRPCQGFKHDIDSYIVMSSIKDIELTDINALKKLPWHMSDWTNLPLR